jgi:23S rRNA (adenine2030-N6)-methyltransferase
MNYRHAFHAGSFVDVVKHCILSLLVDYLKRKPAAFRVIDTHAGVGRYDLTGSEAQRSPEWREGIGRLLARGLSAAAAALAEPYLAAVRAENPGSTLTSYPGSPLLIRRWLRAQDRLEAIELHPADAGALKALFAGDIQVRVNQIDGWSALPAHLPPKEKRGLVLVDPPFEEAGEFGRLVQGLVRGHRRFPNGMFALWYPLKEPGEVRAFADSLAETGIPRVLRAELTIRNPSMPARLYGSGMIVVNPPFTLEDQLRVLLPALADVLADSGRGGWRVDWIRGE